LCIMKRCVLQFGILGIITAKFISLYQCQPTKDSSGIEMY
jgi:hypothetical protein